MKYHPTHPMAGDDLKELALEKEEVDKAFRPSIRTSTSMDSFIFFLSTSA